MSSPKDWTSVLLEGLMNVPHEMLNTSPEGLNVSSAELCIAMCEELIFPKKIGFLPKGLSVSSGGITKKNHA